MKEDKKYYLWSHQELLKHRISKISNAINRRDRDYLLERQNKLLRVFPNSLMGRANISFDKRGSNLEEQYE